MTGDLLAQCIRSRIACACCAVVVLLALVFPPNGPNLPLCSFKAVTHLPCLACGLTRSFIGMAHLRVARAGFYNPAGVILFPFVLLVGAMLPAPETVRLRAAAAAERYRRPLDWIGVALLVVFFVNGIGRICWLLATGAPSPW